MTRLRVGQYETIQSAGTWCRVSRNVPIGCGLFLFELAPAPFVLCVPRSSGAVGCGDAPADRRVESRSRTGDVDDKGRPILSDTFSRRVCFDFAAGEYWRITGS